VTTYGDDGGGMEIIFPTHFSAIRKITDEKNKGRVGDKNNKGKVGTKIIKGGLGHKDCRSKLLRLNSLPTQQNKKKHSVRRSVWVYMVHALYM
jgi:hypothetical protein